MGAMPAMGPTGSMGCWPVPMAPTEETAVRAEQAEWEAPAPLPDSWVTVAMGATPEWAAMEQMAQMVILRARMAIMVVTGVIPEQLVQAEPEPQRAPMGLLPPVGVMVEMAGMAMPVLRAQGTREEMPGRVVTEDLMATEVTVVLVAMAGRVPMGQTE